jgi:hypothetical protein
MNLEVESPMKAKSSGLLSMEMYSDGLGSSVTMTTWMAGRQSEEEAEPMQSLRRKCNKDVNLMLRFEYCI